MKISLLLLTTLSVCTLHAQTLKLWPSTAPGETGTASAGVASPGSPVAGRGITKIDNVTAPELIVFPAKSSKASIPAVIVFPGGGYNILAYDLEGTEICDWLNQHGITAVLVKYRVPGRKGRPAYEAPLQDAQRAMGLVRQHAQEWGIDSARLGVIGFSAGGHLAAVLSNNLDRRTYPRVDAADDLPCKPSFTILIYPAYLVGEKGTGTSLSPEIRVTPQTPPTFLAQAEDDPVGVNNSLSYYLALTQNKVPAELHIFATGGHGYGIRDTGKPANNWPRDLEPWLRTITGSYAQDR
jgi:acetyl esterase/lipase